MVFKPAVVVLQTVHEKVFRWELSQATKAERSAWKAGSLELIRLLIFRLKIPTDIVVYACTN